MPDEAARTDRSSRVRAALVFALRRVMPVAALAAVILGFLWRVRSILPPFLISFFLAALLDPAVVRIQQRGVSRGRAVASIFGVVFGVIFLLGMLIVPVAVGQITELGEQLRNIEGITKQFQDLSGRADHWYEGQKKTLANLGIDRKPSEILAQQSGPISEAVRHGLDTVRESVAGFVSQVLWLVIIPIALFYLLLEFQTIRARLLSLVRPPARGVVDRMSSEIVEIFGAYIRGLSKMCALYSLGATVLFWALGINYSLFLGMAAGVFYAVPYVGPSLTVVSACIIALSMGKSVGFLVLVVCLFLVMHVVMDSGLAPRVIGGSVGLHPLINIFSLMSGAALFGAWGMIVAVPVAASIQMLLIYFIPWLGQPLPPPPPLPGPEAPSEAAAAAAPSAAID